MSTFPVPATTERKLAAILAADVVAYSRLMEEDEAGTFDSLKKLQLEVIEPLVAQHRGRVFKVAGDGFLIEFSSAVHAVQCAVALQVDVSRRNETNEGKIVLRVGVNLGDVIVEGDDLYGDGVNIAARLEGLAEPGSVFVSGTAYDQVKNKTGFGFDDLGVRSIKNIDEPVRVYRAALGTALPIPRVERRAEKPSIAVLPLTNMSGDPAQEYFVDGITEDIITELSRFRQLHVLSRNSSFRYSGKNLDIVRIGRELNVQYLLEGSVRRVGDRIRITAQLIDASSGNHLWAERYDRKEEEIFAVQDQVIRNIVGTLVGRLQAHSAEKAKRKPPSSLAAYEYVLQADALPFERDAAAKARELYQKAIELDPDYARAYALLGLNFRHQWLRDMSGSNSLMEQAHELARKALSLDENDSLCHEIMAWIQLERGSHGLAEHHYEKARDLNPNRAVTVAGQGALYTFLGKPEEGLVLLREAKALDPFFNPSWYWSSVGIGHFVCRQYDDAIACLGRAPYRQPSTCAYLAAACSLSEREEQARSHARETLELLPEFKVEQFVKKQAFKRQNDSEHLTRGLIEAGLI
jgi:adenylate cyclase